jgi:CRISPR-associated protein Csx17
MAFPFHVRSAGGVSTVAESDEDEGRDELWLPLWSRPATIRDVRKLFSEGRATVGIGERARPAASALDFARAIASLGIDRGVDSFQRVGFHVRNGLAYFATPLGRYATREVSSERLLDDVDRWFDRLKQKTNGKGVPARVAVACRRLEQALFDAVSSGRLAPVLLELGQTEQALARSSSFADEAGLRAVPPLRSAWLEFIDRTVEARLAQGLAARPGMGARLGRLGESEGVFVDRPLVDNLHALLLQEDLERTQRKQGPGGELETSPCSLVDIESFIEGEVDDGLIEGWLRALVLVKSPSSGRLYSSTGEQDGRLPPALFAVLAIAYGRRLGDEVISRTTGVLSLACAGNAHGASVAALRRLQASGRPGPLATLIEPTARTRRIAAALAFPLTTRQRRCLESMVLPFGDPSQCLSAQETA